ncbi:unnamed protein product [Parnassius mnemosyne]|uniref:Endonuclease/exonuclease/phosphatase domain-containing protein n=1 Tax=Parnassius mnemosyne TaxID=213953 RepID=A0AAV1LK27_9NEOP
MRNDNNKQPPVPGGPAIPGYGGDHGKGGAGGAKISGGELKNDFEKKFNSMESKISKMENQITTKISKHMDEKFHTIEKELGNIRIKEEEQEKRLDALEKNNVQRNLVFFGVEENEKSYYDLQEKIIDIIKNDIKVEIQQSELQALRRLGKKGHKTRPISVMFTTLGKKISILKNKNKLENTNIYIKHEFPAKILKIREELKIQQQKENEKGNIAYIKYDKLVVKEKYKDTIRVVAARKLDQNPPSQTQKYTNLHLLTYNVRSLVDSTRLPQLEHSLRNIKWDVIGLSEIKKAGQQIEEHGNFVLLYCGEQSGRNGVGFLIQNHLKKYIDNFSFYTDRIVRLDMNFNNNYITFIQIYAPTEKAPESEIENFYNDLRKAMKDIKKDTFIVGDFNAKIGLPREEENLVTGKFGYGSRNSRGQRLIEFCYENKLTITNTKFRKNTKNKWTWQSPDGNTRNEIDYILAKNIKIVSDTEVLNIPFSSDHRAVRTTKEVERRIALAWKKYWSLKEIFKGNFPLQIKKKIMDSNVLPTLTYGCQTWVCNAEIKRKIRSFQRATERSMLKIKLQDRINSSKIRRRTKITDALTTIARLKWKWAGHVIRSSDGRWSERILHWFPRDGKRDRGRPLRRWKDDIEAVAGNLWTRTAKERDKWHEMEEAFIQQWMIPE